MMIIELFYKSIAMRNINDLQRLINSININEVDPETNLSPLEYALDHRCNLEIIKLLTDQGASLVRTTERKETHHNIVIYYLTSNKRYSVENENTLFDWLLEPPQLEELQKEGIYPEHLYAALGRKKKAYDRDIEDNDGLTPMYYAALVGSEHLNTWIIDSLISNFPHHIVGKGLYKGSTGAWWLSFCNKAIDLLHYSYNDILNQLDLEAKPSSKVIGNDPLVVKLSIRRPGLEVLSTLENEKFQSINWSTSVYGKYSLAWQILYAEPSLFAKLLASPTTILQTIDWNEVPVQEKETLAMRVTNYSNRKIHLHNLPSEILNTINWNATGPTFKESLLSGISTNASSFKRVLEKLTNETLIDFINNANTTEAAYLDVLLELVQRLNLELELDQREFSDLNQEWVIERLETLSQLFLLIKACEYSKREIKRIKGLKGQILFRFSNNDLWADLLWNRENLFFKKDPTLNYLEKSRNKVKAQAQYYIMQGNKELRKIGLFYTIDLIRQVTESKPKDNVSTINPVA